MFNPESLSERGAVVRTYGVALKLRMCFSINGSILIFLCLQVSTAEGPRPLVSMRVAIWRV